MFWWIFSKTFDNYNIILTIQVNVYWYNFFFQQGSEFSGARQTDIHEKQRLIQLVHLQAQEIEALKEEIVLLSRKGGHILPPAQPPMPPSSQAPVRHWGNSNGWFDKHCNIKKSSLYLW